MVEERKEERTIDFEPEPQVLDFAIPILPPWQNSFSSLKLCCSDVGTLEDTVEEETMLLKQLHNTHNSLQKVFLNIEDTFLSCPLILPELVKEERAMILEPSPSPSPAASLMILPPRAPIPLST